MPTYACPSCSTQVHGADPQDIVCPTCGYRAEPKPLSTDDAAKGWTVAGSATGYTNPGSPVCPRCHSTTTKAGGVPAWAVALAVILCPLGLLFLLLKDDHVCFNCGMQWR